MRSQKVVTPVKTGVQRFYNYLKFLDSGFRRNDIRGCPVFFYDSVGIGEGTDLGWGLA